MGQNRGHRSKNAKHTSIQAMNSLENGVRVNPQISNVNYIRKFIIKNFPLHKFNTRSFIQKISSLVLFAVKGLVSSD